MVRQYFFVGLKVNLSRYNQSSLYSKGTGPLNTVDGNALTSSITSIGINEFWWGEFDAPHAISSIAYLSSLVKVLLFYFISYIIKKCFRQLDENKINDFILKKH